jgi:alkaline phosphatase D
MLSRRDFLATGLALGATPLVLRAQVALPNPVFRHGVASGDPLTDRVILWTRVTAPRDVTGPIDVEWMIARDPRMSRVVGRGSARTTAARDFTVKVDAAGLDPASTYYYRFAARREQSPIGRTRTLPAGNATRVSLALASCANYPFGHFNVYARIAARRDLDAVLHLGDYIYEYANNRYGNREAGDGTPFGRIPAPNRELLLLDDYRTRYAQYREDPDLQEAHRQHPFIVVWDDHETANNSWRDGAGNHDAGEGEWRARLAAAAQAWWEWMPARATPRQGSGRLPGADGRMYRRFTFGGLADLFMLDTRVTGRDEQVANKDVATIEAASRQLLGGAQEQWLLAGLHESARAKRPWQVLGQQVMFAPQSPTGQPAGNADSWDGYRAARSRVFDAATSAGGGHLVVFTGDVHSSWAYDLARDPFEAKSYDPQSGRGAVGTEIVTPAVTSPAGLNPDRQPAIRAARPHLKFLEAGHRGYVVVELTRERLQADWWLVPTVTERVSAETRAIRLVSEAAAPHLVAVS